MDELLFDKLRYSCCLNCSAFLISEVFMYCIKVLVQRLLMMLHYVDYFEKVSVTRRHFRNFAAFNATMNLRLLFLVTFKYLQETFC